MPGQPAFAAPIEHPPRPRSTAGAILMVLGGALAAIGAFLPWARQGGDTINGLSNYVWIDGFELYSIDAPAMVALVGAATVIGLGIATLVAGRLLAVAVIGIVASALGIFGGLFLFALPTAIVDVDEGSVGIGAILQPIAPIVSLVGSIVVTATRKRPA